VRKGWRINQAVTSNHIPIFPSSFLFNNTGQNDNRNFLKLVYRVPVEVGVMMTLRFAFFTLLFDALVTAEPIDRALSWGPYRPNLYFGIRPREPNGPIFGLMWGSIEDGKLNSQNLRHTCEQSDELANYGWTTYDPRNGGVETISDTKNALNLTLAFVKFPDRLKDWSVRVSGLPLGTAWKWNTTVIFYLGVEQGNNGTTPEISCTPSSNGMVNCQGDEFHTSMPPPNSKGTQSTSLRSLRVAKDNLWQAKCKKNRI